MLLSYINFNQMDVGHSPQSFQLLSPARDTLCLLCCPPSIFHYHVNDQRSSSSSFTWRRCQPSELERQWDMRGKVPSWICKRCALFMRAYLPYLLIESSSSLASHTSPSSCSYIFSVDSLLHLTLPLSGCCFCFFFWSLVKKNIENDS